MIILVPWIDSHNDCGIGLLDPPFPAAALKRRRTLTDWRKFEKLGSLYRPGLTEEEFLGLFAQCNACKLITMHRLFYEHACEP